MTIILIDGSYFVFYRYYATLAWWRHQQTEENQSLNDLHENKDFVEKFIDLFERRLAEIPQKLKIKEPFEIHVAYDCPRSQIWRNKHTENYKATRKNNSDVGHFFKLVMDRKLFEKPDIISGNLCLDCLEADDCIALFIKKVYDLHPSREIYVITNDHDYLQLKTENIYLINLKYQKVGHNKTTGDPQKDLFIKAVCGDKSDNIQKIFNNKKIGPKRAETLYNQRDIFKQLCDEDTPETYTRFLQNMNIISFDSIPNHYVNLFYDKYFNPTNTQKSR